MDDTVLMAYVDGALPPREREQVEKRIAASPELAARVSLLAASHLPYRDAFAQQRLPPLPQHLQNQIEQLTREHSAKRGHSSANDSALRHDSLLPPSAPVRSPLRSGLPAPGWLAVAFIAGAFFCGAALRFMPGLGEARAPAGSVAMSTSPWVQAVVAYQQLYSRKTLADEVSSVSANNEVGDRNNDRNNDSTADAIRARRIVEAIRRDDGLALRIPDLREAGLKFARVERLSFHGRPLVQIEYLPPNGPPIALCVIKDAKPDRPIASEHVSGMRVVTWRQSELAYALVGNDSGVDLAALGNKIAERSVDELL